ncbi:MAG: pitrilysin family protein [Bacteroidales bacterium]|nr:pitrilysin family protein [Bacteroidales bacterium]
MEFETLELENGIRLVHKQISSPVAHLGVIINAGSKDELAHEHGMAHFIEHVIFKGTQKRKAYHILNNLDNVGGDINAYTTKEDTCIYASFLNQYYKRAAELISDICFNSVFPEKELPKEKEVIYDEINQYKDNPAEDIFENFESLIFKNHPLGKSILGQKKTISRFTREDIFKFIKNNYKTNQIVVSSVGNIGKKELVKIFKKHFSEVIPNCSENKLYPIEKYKPEIKLIKRAGSQCHTIIGSPSYSLYDKQKTSMSLLNNLLGGPGLNCRLNMNIREKFGFCYSIDSNYLPLADTGIFSVYFATDNKHNEKAEMLVLKELSKLRNEKLGTLQLLRAKNQLKGQIAISNESKLNEMLSIGKSLLVYNKIDSIEEVYNKIDKISAENLQDVANEMFDEKNLSKLTYQKK